MWTVRRPDVASVVVFGALIAGHGFAQQSDVGVAPFVSVRPIAPPDKPLPPETVSAAVTRFSFIAYGDTRSQVDGQAPQPDHGALVENMLAKIKALASTPFPVRFVLQSGDAVASGPQGAQWNVSFSPLIEKLTRGAGVSYFFAIGNHDEPAGDPGRALGLHNTLAAISRLIPPEGSPHRLNGYATYAFGYGNLFAIAIDSNIASDAAQLAWVTDQLEHVDRSRYRHVVAFFHHPLFSAGPHGGIPAAGIPAGRVTQDSVEPMTAALRSLYGPLFRQYKVRVTITGHDHLFDHWVERYVDGGVGCRIDHLVSGGGGAPTYTYSGEPAVQGYLRAGAIDHVRLEHLMKPGNTVAENPHHFLVIQVDGDRLSVEVVGVGSTPYAPYNGRSRVDLQDPP
jgi:hypothetical protein